MWTDEEDEQLRALVAEYGVKKWALISTKMAAKGAKQCRRRWQNYLNNDIKQGGWSEEEDRILLEGHRLHGNKWTEIARMVTGRTDNAVKNRHAVLVKKEEKKVEDSRGGGTPSGSGKRKRAPFQPPDASGRLRDGRRSRFLEGGRQRAAFVAQSATIPRGSAHVGVAHSGGNRAAEAGSGSDLTEG